MKRIRTLCFLIAIATSAVVLADDLLGSQGGGSSSGSSSGGSNSGSSSGSGSSSSGSGGGQRNQGRNDDGPVTVRSEGRSETRTNNNRRRNQDDPIIIGSVPQGQGGSNAGRARTEDTVRVGGRDRFYSGWRTGYFQYDDRWHDGFWDWDYYRYDWRGPNLCVVSPFYSYSTQPPYLDRRRVRWGVPRWSDDWRSVGRWEDDFRDWEEDDEWSGRRNWRFHLEDAMHDLERVFERRDMRRLEDILPRSGWITIQSPCGGTYAVTNRDFRSLMRDLVFGTRTRELRFTDVQMGRRFVRIEADHIWDDAWRRTRSQRLTFIFESQRDGSFDLVELGARAGR